MKPKIKVINEKSYGDHRMECGGNQPLCNEQK